MLTFIKNILQLIISPDNGWEDIKNEADSDRAFRGMSWTLVVSALACLIQVFYSGGATIAGQLQLAIVVVVAYWATYYVADFALTVWIPRINEGVIEPRNLKLFICYIVTLLSLQQLFTGLLPLRITILDLWPLYVLVIAWRAMKMLEIDTAKTERFLIINVVSFMLPSQLLIWVFKNYVL